MKREKEKGIVVARSCVVGYADWAYLYVCCVEGVGVCMSLSCENEWSYGVMVSTLDSESSDPGSNPGRTLL